MYRTPIKINPSDNKIDHSQNLMSLGSCFADRMGERMVKNKFNLSVNPFGITYNPVSLARNLTYLISNKPLAEDSYVKNGDVFYNYNLHGDFSNLSLDALRKRVNQTIRISHDHLKSSRWLILTMGTAIVYERTDTSELVANCHKLPSRRFNKRFLSIEEIEMEFSSFHKALMAFNPEAHIILTVSPVRHTREGLADNSKSKAILRLACDNLATEFDNVEYFPSYEIMIDDLRDYRFYQEDMIHPSKTAEDYIWDLFSQTYFSSTTRQILEEWNKILQALNHRPFHEESPAHRQFLQKLLMQMEIFNEHLDIGTE